MKAASLACCIPAALALAACSGADQPEQAEADAVDPLLAGALGEQIMVDPDLVAQNQANRLATLGPESGAVPTLDDGAEAIAAARADALELLGGRSAVRKAPDPQAISGALPPEAALSVAARAALSGTAEANCVEAADFTMAWAARMPAAFPVYPRAAVQEAAGTDTAGCALRVVNFRTPVPLGEVVDFYDTRAVQAGFETQRILRDGDDVLAGTRDGQGFVLYTRQMPGGLTEADLVTSGR